MPIDDPFDAFKKHYYGDESKLPTELAKLAEESGLALMFPDGGLVLDLFLKVSDALFNKTSQEERVRAMFELMKNEFSHVETTKASHEDMQRAIQLAFCYDRQERDDLKRARYIKLIGSVLRSETQIRDVVSFIKMLEQLNERDLIVLKVINRVMNKKGDWKAQPQPGDREIWKLHPNEYTSRSQELANQIALALDQNVHGDMFGREEGFSICNRLQGFGLAHEVEQTRELPLANYVFRLSLQGIMLLKLLGEDVENFHHYFHS